MRSTLLLVGLSFAAAGTVLARPPGDQLRPRDLNAIPRIASPAGDPLAGLVPVHNETVYFGGTTWAPDSMRWEALRDSVWTFDSGVGSAIKEPGHSYPFVDPSKPDGLHAFMEGWVGVDRTAPKETAFRRLASSDPRWHGDPCVGAAVGLGGNWSFWAGVFADEADSLCWASGKGYGNSWYGCIEHSFLYTGGVATLSYRYRNDTEPGYDFTTVWVDTTGGLGNDALVQSYDGQTQGLASLVLTPGTELPSTPGTILLKFCFSSDRSWSDEDGFYPTSCGAFALDNVALTGGVTHFADFEIDDGGWKLIPKHPGDGGEWSNLVALEDLPSPSPGLSCAMTDSVLAFYDPSMSGHPWFQENLVVSPWIDLARAGVTDYSGRIVELRGYFDMPLLNYVFILVRAQWYPDSSFVTDRGCAGEFHGTGLSYYFGEVPTCLNPGDARGIVNLSSVIPAHATGIRIAVGVINACRYYMDCDGLSNSTPWFDNIRFGVCIPSKIQDAIDLAVPGDTVWVLPGLYSGPGNRDLTFRGKHVVLKSIEGPEQTIIDCEELTRGFVFNSGEDSLTVVDGFTIRNGRPPPGAPGDERGGGILITGGASPTIVRSIVSRCRAADGGGGIFVESGSGLRLIDSEVSENQSANGGGINSLYSGQGIFLRNCRITENAATHWGGGLLASALTMEGGAVSGNRSRDGAGLYLGINRVLVLGTIVSENEATGYGGGIWFGYCLQLGCGSRAEFRGCRILNNRGGTGGGLFGYAGLLVDCEVAGNTAQNRGGGGYLNGPHLQDCRISGNSAEEGGGLFATWYSGNLGSDCYASWTPRIEACQIVGNSASHGGGVTFANASASKPCPAMVLQTSISGNRADRGGAVFIDQATEVNFTRSVIWGNCADSSGAGAFMEDSTAAASIDCSILDPADWTGSGNVTYLNPPLLADPFFCRALECAAAPDTSGVYSVVADSPCLPENNLCHVLIGALGVGCDFTSVVEDPPPTPPPVTRRLAALPNPCKGSTRLVFDRSSGGPVSLRIVALDGRMVRSFEISGHTGELSWDGTDRLGRDVPTGVYFVELRSDRRREMTRLVLIR